MYYKNKKNIVTTKIMQELFKLESIANINRTIDINKMPIDHISCSLTASKQSASTSNEIEGITITKEQTPKQNNNAQKYHMLVLVFQLL